MTSYKSAKHILIMAHFSWLFLSVLCLLKKINIGFYPWICKHSFIFYTSLFRWKPYKTGWIPEPHLQLPQESSDIQIKLKLCLLHRSIICVLRIILRFHEMCNFVFQLGRTVEYLVADKYCLVYFKEYLWKYECLIWWSA